jgi:hypothetical protein
MHNRCSDQLWRMKQLTTICLTRRRYKEGLWNSRYRLCTTDIYDFSLTGTEIRGIGYAVPISLLIVCFHPLRIVSMCLFMFISVPSVLCGSAINRHSSVTNVASLPGPRDEINLSGNYNSNRQALLEDGRQIQDVHSSSSPLCLFIADPSRWWHVLLACATSTWCEWPEVFLLW